MGRLDGALGITRLMFPKERPGRGQAPIDQALNVARPLPPGGPRILMGGGGEQRTVAASSPPGSSDRGPGAWGRAGCRSRPYWCEPAMAATIPRRAGDAWLSPSAWTDPQKLRTVYPSLAKEATSAPAASSRIGRDSISARTPYWSALAVQAEGMRPASRRVLR